MKVGVIGMGSQGLRLAGILEQQEQEVVRFDVVKREGVHNAADVWRHKVDAVVIASPAETHVEHLRRAIWHDIRAIFIEKPLADRLTPELTTLVEKTKAWPCQLGYNLRFDPRVAALRDRVQNDRPRFGWYHTASDFQTWPGLSYGSALLECSHEIDAALWMLGRGTCAGAVSCGHDVFDLTIRHECGANSHIHMNYASNAYHRTHQVLMANGDIDEIDLAVPDVSMYADEIAHWLHAVTVGTPTDAPLKVGLDTLQIIEEARCLASLV